MPGTEHMAKLVTEAQNGNMDAFNELYNASSKTLESIGYSILHKQQDVEDALQDTYITIYRSFSGQGIAPLKDPEKFLPWAKTIMRNTCLNKIDEKKRKAGKDELRPMNSEEDHEGMDTIENVDDDRDFSPEDATEAVFIRSLIDAALAEIPIIRQTCLSLHQQGLSYHEIGERLSIPEGTAKSHVRYARLQLQKVVKEIEEREQVQIHGFFLVPGAANTFIPVFLTKKKEESAGWIAAEEGTASVAGAASMKHAAGKHKVGTKIAAVAMSVVVAAGATVFGVSESRDHSSPNHPVVAQVVQSDGSQDQERETSEGQVEISFAYKALNRQRRAADRSLKKLKRDKDLETAAERRAKQYAQLGESFRPDGSSRYYPSGVMAEEPAMTGVFNLPTLDSDDLTSDTESTVGIGCYVKNGNYYWVIAYA